MSAANTVLAGMAVLIVGQDDDDGAELGARLADFGTEPSRPVPPTRVAERLTQDTPDVVLIDAREGLDGPALTQLERAYGEHDVPYVIVVDRAQAATGLVESTHAFFPRLLDPFEAVDLACAVQAARMHRTLLRSRMDSEDRLRKVVAASESRYRAVVQDQTEFIVRWLPNGVRTFVNEAYARYFGGTPEALIGTSFFPLIVSEEARERVRENLARLTPESPVMVDVHKSWSAEGDWRWQEWVDRGFFDEDGRLVELQSVGRDVHDRVVTEAFLRESEARFRAVFDQAFQFAGLLETDGTVIEVNRTALEFLDLSEEDVIGCPFWETPWWSHSSELQAELREHIREAAAGKVIRREVTHIAPDGSTHILDFSLKPMRDEAGEVKLLIPEGRDITEIKHLGAQLRHSQRLHAIGQLAGGVAHDFNNLLTALWGSVGYLEAVLSEEDEEVRASLADIRTVADKASLMTKQLLAFSRNQELRPQVVDLNDVIRRSESVLDRLVGSRIEVSSELDSSLTPVHVDPGQIEQVFLNLIVNARDAMPDGGRLKIATRNVAVDPMVARHDAELQSGSYACLEVADTGHGIPEHLRTRIFEPFFTTKEAGTGTGLGLSTVYGIVQQSGGALTVESEVDEGAVFRVFLPARG